MAKISLFVVLIDKFEEDIKTYGLNIIDLSQECAGYEVTIEGPYPVVHKFLTELYCQGMDDEMKAELFTYTEDF